MMEWMILPLKRYAQFNGRSRRMEYWMWILFTVIVGVVLGILDSILGLDGIGTRSGNGPLGILFSLATLLPSLAVAVRRLHDTNHSGWWILLPVLPAIVLLGAIFASIPAVFGGGGSYLIVVAIVAGLAVMVSSILLLVWYCTAGTDGPNDYGDDPKADLPSDLARTFE